jgi:hypothetical protein
MKDIVTIIRANPEAYAPTLMQQAADEIELLRIGVATALKERDEARRCVCCQALPSNYKEWKPSDVDSALKFIAVEQNWDCFKGEGK